MRGDAPVNKLRQAFVWSISVNMRKARFEPVNSNAARSAGLIDSDQSAHLPALFHDSVNRLRHPLPFSGRTLKSRASVAQGFMRR
jgi:hypothetical protein